MATVSDIGDCVIADQARIVGLFHANPPRSIDNDWPRSSSGRGLNTLALVDEYRRIYQVAAAIDRGRNRQSDTGVSFSLSVLL
jgi:hypothetical protein